MIWILIIVLIYILSIYLSRKLFLLCYNNYKNNMVNFGKGDKINHNKDDYIKAIKCYGLVNDYPYCMHYNRYDFFPSIYNTLLYLVPIINTITVIVMTFVAISTADLGKNTAKRFFYIDK